ncbi:MAG: alcohol dehydrogenase catalytic domain-containing protein [Anaerolineae bacterium]|nr:alcohol dehydrogenase catalytic domain-containing protein [Anaerolineae bacterium]
MKAAILYNDRDIRVGNAPDPRVGPGEVLIGTCYAGICGTDLHIYRGEFHSRVTYPAILGHEFGGLVQEVGQGVTGFRVGDRVVVDPILSCHRCPACLSGHLNACQQLKLLGVEYSGGFGQYVVAPADRVYPLPDEVPMRHASMVEMYALGHHILQRGRVQPGESVGILGAGKLGLSVLDVLCHSASPGLTMAADLQPSRLVVARQLGAEYAVNLHDEDPVALALEITGGVGLDCVIEAVGHYHIVDGRDPPLAQAVKMIRNGGRIVTAGLGEQLSAVHFKTLVLKEAEMIASRVTLGEFPRAMRLMARGLLHPDLLITHCLPLAQVTRAFQQVDGEDPETLKVVLDLERAEEDADATI